LDDNAQRARMVARRLGRKETPAKFPRRASQRCMIDSHQRSRFLDDIVSVLLRDPLGIGQMRRGADYLVEVLAIARHAIRAVDPEDGVPYWRAAHIPIGL